MNYHDAAAILTAALEGDYETLSDLALETTSTERRNFLDATELIREAFSEIDRI